MQKLAEWLPTDCSIEIDRLVLLYITKFKLLSFVWDIETDDTQEEPATIHCEYPYNFFTLYLGKSIIERWEADRLDWIIKHELSHIPISRIRALADRRHVTEKEIDDAEESLACYISTLV
jgi:hypothetical protein